MRACVTDTCTQSCHDAPPSAEQLTAYCLIGRPLGAASDHWRSSPPCDSWVAESSSILEGR
jgi:hypothetical protein